MKILHPFLIIAGKVILLSIRFLKIGSGSTWPGHLCLLLDENFISCSLSKNKGLKIVLIAGTNGKTTTAGLITHIAKNAGFKTMHNTSGANLLNGIASSILDNSNWLGKIKSDAAVFEVDENTLPLVVEHLTPNFIVLLNLFRDQLDRYGEVNLIAEKWLNTIKNVNKNATLVVNGDDPQLTFIAENSNLNTNFFAIDDRYKICQSELANDADFAYCPRCNNKLTFYSISYSHLGNFVCKKCGFKNKKSEITNTSSYLFGIYNKYNLSCAALVAKKLFDLSFSEIKKSIGNFPPSFGRQEKLEFKGKKGYILLSKNPASFNRSIEAINSFSKANDTLLLVLNDRIPDGRDVSWIWDVDFENISKKFKKIYLSGERAYDLALRIKYSELGQKVEVLENLVQAIRQIAINTKSCNSFYILPTYSAMLETRKIIIGKKIL